MEVAIADDRGSAQIMRYVMYEHVFEFSVLGYLLRIVYTFAVQKKCVIHCHNSLKRYPYFLAISYTFFKRSPFRDCWMEGEERKSCITN